MKNFLFGQNFDRWFVFDWQIVTVDEFWPSEGSYLANIYSSDVIEAIRRHSNEMPIDLRHWILCHEGFWFHFHETQPFLPDRGITAHPPLSARERPLDSWGSTYCNCQVSQLSITRVGISNNHSIDVWMTHLGSEFSSITSDELLPRPAENCLARTSSALRNCLDRPDRNDSLDNAYFRLWYEGGR